MLTALIAVFAALSLFNFIFIVFMVTQPRELKDSSNNLDYYKVFWYALIFFILITLVYVAIVLLTQRRHHQIAQR